VKGQLIGLDRGHYEALRADRELQERKFGHRRKGKGKQKGRARFKRTISPTVPPHAVVVEPIAPFGAYAPKVVVEHRSIAVYAQLGGEVCHA
jgi:hypothetical protein